MFFSANHLIASAVSVAIVAAWSRYSPKVASLLTGIPQAAEDKFKIDLPDWFVTAWGYFVQFLVGAFNDVLGNKSVMTQVVNKIRKNKGDEAADIFIEHAKSAVSVDKLERVLPEEIRGWLNDAREELVAEGMKAKVDAVLPLLPEPVRAVALKTVDNAVLLPAIRAAVIAQKVEVLPKTDLKTQGEEAKKHLDFLSAEGRTKVEEMRVRLGMAKPT